MGVGFAGLADRELPWLDGSGPYAQTVISTRVRLARNLRARRFAHHAAEADLAAIRQEVGRRVLDCPAFSGGGEIVLGDCLAQERKYLLERHLASHDLLRDVRHRSLLLSADLSRAVMVNEEDHLRLQVFRSGFDPVTTCADALALDDELEQVLDFAYAEELGYLTACPTNVGTAFRISVLIHLPALVLTSEIEKILNSLRQLQFTVRGLYGEGSAVRGALFQISNMGTLGRSEEGITNDFTRHVSKVIQYEQLARGGLFERDAEGVRDMASRSLGILRSSHLMTSQEAFDRLSHVRLGVCLDIVPFYAMGQLNRVLVEMQPAHVQVAAGNPVKGRERAARRAAYLRRVFA
jgi:protein arginine kinase